MKLNIDKNDKMIQILGEVLSSQTRLRLINAIRSMDDPTHHDLAERLGTSEASISYHLAKLVDAGVVTERRGKGLKNTVSKIPTIKLKQIVINFE